MDERLNFLTDALVVPASRLADPEPAPDVIPDFNIFSVFLHPAFAIFSVRFILHAKSMKTGGIP